MKYSHCYFFLSALHSDHQVTCSLSISSPWKTYNANPYLVYIRSMIEMIHNERLNKCTFFLLQGMNTKICE